MYIRQNLFCACENLNKLNTFAVGPSPRPTVPKSPANSAGSDIRFKPYDLNKTVPTNKQRSTTVKVSAPGQRNSPSNGPSENGTVVLGQNYRCYICEKLYPRIHMEW